MGFPSPAQDYVEQRIELTKSYASPGSYADD